MNKTPESLAQLHRIREQIYEAEKTLSPRERLEHLHQQAQAYLKRTGLKLPHASPPSRSLSVR
jgi:hypothetical protein